MMSSDLIEADHMADLKSLQSQQVNIHAVLISLWNLHEFPRERSTQFFKRLNLVAQLQPARYLIKLCMNIID